MNKGTHFYQNFCRPYFIQGMFTFWIKKIVLIDSHTCGTHIPLKIYNTSFIVEVLKFNVMKLFLSKFLILLFLFFGGPRVWAQSLALARQALCHLSHASSPHTPPFLCYSLDRVLNFCLGLAWTLSFYLWPPTRCTLFLLGMVSNHSPPKSS
jgi:hypothetical protein